MRRIVLNKNDNLGLLDIFQKLKEDEELRIYKKGDIITIQIFKIHTKEFRTLNQNRTWYKLFSAISNYLGYNIDEVKLFLLSGCFGTKKISLGATSFEVPIISKTSSLTKKEGIFFIDTILSFIKKYNIPIDFSSRDINNLYDSYKANE